MSGIRCDTLTSVDGSISVLVKDLFDSGTLPDQVITVGTESKTLQEWMTLVDANDDSIAVLEARLNNLSNESVTSSPSGETKTLAQWTELISEEPEGVFDSVIINGSEEVDLFLDTGAATVGYTSTLTLGSYNGSTYTERFLVSSGNLTPYVDGTGNIGTSIRKYLGMYATDYYCYDEMNFWGNSENKRGRIRKLTTAGRDEFQVNAAQDAFDTGSAGAGIALYGNNDPKHAGNFVVLTGQSEQGNARMIITGGSDDPTSDGYRTNTDTRVTIGNSLYTFTDNAEDTALLTLKDPIGRPALYILGAGSTEGDISVPNGEALSMGHWNGSTFTERCGYGSAGHFRPSGDGVYSCGEAGRRWSVVYAASGSINTSDARMKTELVPLDEREKAAAKEIKDSIGFYKWLSSVEEKGDDARLHCGVTVQKVIEVLEKHDLEPFSYAMVCYDEKDGEGNVIDQYSLRYNDLILFILAAL